jgi:C_GCAxxG_C_C family probable redox protein
MEDKTTSMKILCEKAFDLGVNYEKTCTGCAQSTVAALLETLQIEDESIFRSASGLADGLGLTGDSACGGLTGGAMIIGLLFGRTSRNFQDPFAALRSYDLVKLLHEDFIARYGTCRCYDIQKKLMGRSFNLRSPEDIEAALAANMQEHCATVVGNAASAALKIILADKPQSTSEQHSQRKPKGVCGA